ncbi:sulfurtransferase [Burkholderiaceae bacterium DAT-1]|nr:sulfurtransferase [Burkholderiaceae bacterium DAT-1]
MTSSAPVFSPLITAEALQACLHSGDRLCIVDCRHDLAQPDAGAEAYRQAHIPGAIHLHLDSDLSGTKTGMNGRHPLPSADALAERLGKAGIGSASRVIAYDASGGMYAARLWWLLRWLGHDAVQVLDGGWQAWLAAGGASTDHIPTTSPEHLMPRIRESWTVSAADVLANLDSRDALVVDARAPSRFAGMGETLDPVGGHIPHARNRFFQDNLGTDGRFKSPEVLREEWLGVLSDYDVTNSIQQCGSGVTACHNLLALEVAGLSGARLYPGSWSEWCADPARPVVTSA